jgi:hypothetical protein
MTPTKQELIDAAVTVVQENARKALDGEGDNLHRFEYTDAYQVATRLIDRGLITHERLIARSSAWRDQARKSLDAKTKRLLDAEMETASPRLVRHRRDDGPAPRLSGERRPLYSGATGYTTPELYQRAEEAVAAKVERQRADTAELAELLKRAEAVGMPAPVVIHPATVVYDVAGLREIVEAMERFDR